MFGYVGFAAAVFAGLGAPPAVTYIVTATEVIASSDTITTTTSFNSSITEPIALGVFICKYVF